MSRDLLGRREDQTTEFKAAKALEDPNTIARAVVGMLNASGGEIFIGVDDEDGAAVAINPVSDAEREKDRLQDHLVDTVDPSPTAEEVSLETLPAGTAPAVLAVRVRPKEERKPYAFRKGGGLYFLRRVGARNQPMSRQEILGPGAGLTGEAENEAVRKLVAARETAQQSRGEGLWIGMRPLRKLELDAEDSRLEEIASDPLITGNRRSGWHFARSSRRPRVQEDGLEWGLWDEAQRKDHSQVKVATDGALEFWASLQRLHWKGEEHELWPLALLEYPISAFRVAREVYRGRLDLDDQVAIHSALLGVGGWELRAGTPGDFFVTEHLHRVEETDLVWDPEVLEFRIIDEGPDRSGFRFVRRIYHAFGLREDAIPLHYDRASGRLVLPPD